MLKEIISVNMDINGVQSLMVVCLKFLCAIPTNIGMESLAAANKASSGFMESVDNAHMELSLMAFHVLLEAASNAKILMLFGMEKGACAFQTITRCWMEGAPVARKVFTGTELAAKSMGTNWISLSQFAD